ncbi:MAG TPA: NapC/NirT family cytochrome c [Symbiobacteriaceae bacterium]|nr:NapC/NirT family cytochrome c [Symbiobacteriaceae bacterium]
MPKWGKRLLFTAAGLLGFYLLAALLLQVPAVGQAMGSTAACGTCHLMGPEVKSFQRSAHKDLACLDCHSAHGFWAKPLDEARSAGVHLWVTLTRSEPDVVSLAAHSQENMQANCRACHATLVEGVHLDDLSKLRCTDCHRSTPHDGPNIVVK